MGKNLASVKVLALTGGYGYIWLSHYSTSLHGPPWFFWSTYALLVAGTIALFSFFSAQPERQERQYLVSLGLACLALGYLFALHPKNMLALLVGLVLVCGFYNFVLPRTTGLLLSVLVLLLYLVPVLIYSSTPAMQDEILTPRAITAMLVAGVFVLVAVMLLSRRIKRSVDAIFTTTEDLALDLTSQVVDSEISVEELAEKNREARTLLEVLKNMVSVLEWDELFENIVRAFHNRFEFDKFCLYLYNEEKGKLELRVDAGSEKAAESSRELAPDEGVAGWSFTNGRGVLIDDVKKDPRYSGFSDRDKRIRSLVCQPLILRGEKLDVLCLDSEKVGSFDENAFRVLESLTPLISVAVSNSISYAVVKEESFTDSLTGLRNHRGFLQTFLPLLESAYCEDFPISLIMLDLDDFKKINDTYGHQVGNLVLVDLAEILNEFFRGSDLVARWGGEEFVVVLNGTPPDISQRITEQLRRKVETHQFPISLQRDTFKQITISLGLSATADKNLSPDIVRGSRDRGEGDVFLRNVEGLCDKMVENADQAMYVAKQEGKNQVRLSYHYPVEEVSGESLARMEG